MKQFSALVISLSFLLLTACSGVQATPVPVSTAAVAPTAVPPSPPPITSIPLPAETPIPTATPSPTAAPTLSPTAAPQPTDTPAPTSSPPPLPTDTPASANIPLSEIAARMGQEATVSGQVTAVSSFPGGFKFILDDGHGRITLLMWHDVYDEAWDAPQLNVGATVQATGEVGEFEGELQIVPNFGGDVKVITPGAPYAPQPDIGDLGAYIESTEKTADFADYTDLYSTEIRVNSVQFVAFFSKVLY